MDVFFEQIVEIKKTAKDYLILAIIWILAIGISVTLLVSFFGLMGPIIIIAPMLLCYGAYKLSMNFFVEYEYIITNGTLDIDKIVAKNSRKRILSIEISNVDNLEKYNPNKMLNGYSKITLACNKDDSNAYGMSVGKEGLGRHYIVFSPNDKLKAATVKYLPKHISNSAFK